ncbi:MAG: FAD-binding oxidoreductase [Candidatus Obscuribacterales bacterium]|nr:FAD-binding oxidoreductase [Candidatus Obscuribacterales bacterium]
MSEMKSLSSVTEPLSECFKTFELAIYSTEQLNSALKKARSEEMFVLRGKCDQSRVGKLNKLKSHRSKAVFLDVTPMSNVIEHVREDQVISVEAGITIKQLNEYLSKHGQWLPIEHYSDSTTIADVLDEGDGGTLETFCSVKQLVLGMELAVAGGTSIKTGGKIVKNVTGYDLGKVFVGTRGWLAVPHSVHLRLFSKPEAQRLLAVPFSHPKNTILFANAIMASGLPLHCLEAVDARLLLQLTDLGAECRRTLGLFPDNCQSILLIGTRGHQEVVADVEKALEVLIAKAGLSAISVTHVAEELQRAGSGAFQPLDRNYLEVSLAASHMAYFFETRWEQLAKPFWSARIASGRLRLAKGNTIDDEHLLEAMRPFAQLINSSGTQPLTVSYSNSSMDLIVQRLDASLESQQALSAVIKRLKHNYDPQSDFNPLVRF